METIGLLFPHQLFLENPILKKTKNIIIIEDSLFFNDPHTKLKFHKQKILFHRASMKYYANLLKKQGCKLQYVNFQKNKSMRTILPELNGKNIICIDPTDYLLEKRLRERFGKNIEFLDSPLFLNTKKENKKWYQNSGKFFMKEFYKYQRKKMNILLDEHGGPLGGSWSYDEENRRKIPNKDVNYIKDTYHENTNNYIKEARIYVNKNFKEHIGKNKHFFYPVTHKEAEDWFEEFLKNRLTNFGTYEDAMVSGKNILYHSLLSPLLNVGLLDPKKVIEKTISYSQENFIPLNSLEGFIRQIIGWREFIRMVYEEKGTKIRNQNLWKHKEDLPSGYYFASIGIKPIDESINKIIESGYTHHIERLMLHGNFLFLNETKPNHVYKWFMEMFIDSYDWVMVPNVYAMTQNTSRGIMTTKPYISGSNYILKMSNYKKGNWTKTWDALYWSFIIKHIEILKSQGRMFYIIKRAEKFNKKQLKNYENIKNNYLKNKKTV